MEHYLVEKNWRNFPILCRRLSNYKLAFKKRILELENNMKRLSLLKPIYLVLFPIITSLFILIVALGYHILAEYQADIIVERQLLNIAAEIRYYDEVLTMSANMGALTGDSIWERRYMDVVGKLDLAMTNAVGLNLESKAYIDEVSVANQHLIALESKAFDLVRAGRKAEAIDMMFSDEYKQYKLIYSDGISSFITSLQEAQKVHERQKNDKLVISTIMIFFLFLSIIFILLYTFRLLAKHLDIENLLIQVSRRLLSQGSERVDEDIQWFLAMVADKAKADYACLVHRSGVELLNVWYYSDTTSSANDMTMRLSDISMSMKSDSNGIVDWTDISRQSGDERLQKQMLKEMGIESYICVTAVLNHADELQISLASTRRRLAFNRADYPILISLLEIISQAIKQQAHKDRLFELATKDSLTGLINRNSFLEKLKQVMEQQKCSDITSALLMLDIDHFKRINDTYGHAVGDLALAYFAKRVKSCLREIDVVGRLGGEEFAVILPNTNAEDALIVAERIRKAIESGSVITSSETVHFTVSIGGTMIVTADQERGVPLKRADSAMYIAKQEGRNQVQFLFLESK